MMTSVGIDCAAFYTSHYYLELADLAAARGVEPNKYLVGLGQHQMAVSPPDEDIITLAANAAEQVLSQIDRNDISAVFFATESGIDHSKSAGVFVHHLLKLPQACRAVEFKQACYSGTAALQMACDHIRVRPEQKILVIMSDIARYGLNTSGESSQGGGAVALVVSANPRLLALSPHAGYACEDVMDFWRPNYREEALVDGKYSCEMYLKILKDCWHAYREQSGLGFDEHHRYLFHIPIPRLAEKAYQKLKVAAGAGRPNAEEIDAALSHSLKYSRTIGNCYTASLYLGLLSLLEHTEEDLSGQRLGLYSYGSGCVGEFFSGEVQPGYQAVLNTAFHRDLLASRTRLDVAQYETFYDFAYPKDGGRIQLPHHATGHFRLNEISQHKRIYKRLA